MNTARKISLTVTSEHHSHANKTLEDLAQRYPVYPIHSQKDHEYFKSILLKAIRVKKELQLAESQKAGLNSYIELLKIVISSYENEKFQFSKQDPVELLNELKQLNNTKQQDLAEVLGISQAQVSRLLSGERKLTKDQIEALSKHYNVSPALFFKDL